MSNRDTHRIDPDVEQEIESEVEQGERNRISRHVSEPSPNVIYTP